MKVGASGASQISGPLYKRQNVGYASGSKYKRFGNFGLVQQRNLSSMNRRAIDNYRSAVAYSGPIVFDAKQTESEGLSEIAAMQVLKRAQDAAAAIAAKSKSLGLAGSGGSVNKTA
jgi:hypothetical protein